MKTSLLGFLELMIFAGMLSACAGDFRPSANAMADGDDAWRSSAPQVQVITTTTSTTTSTTVVTIPPKVTTNGPDDVEIDGDAGHEAEPGAGNSSPPDEEEETSEKTVEVDQRHLLRGMSAGDFQYQGTIRPTVYYKPLYTLNEESCEEKDLVNLRGKEKEVLLQLCPRMKSECLLQGSCLIRTDDRLRSFNYFRMQDKMPLFAEIDTEVCPYGLGLSNICLDPFYTVAADKSLMKKGDVIFVPAIVGMDLPNGQRHNGYLVVRDSGGAIKGKGRFDFFSGYIHWRNRENPFTQAGLISKSTNKDWFIVSGESAELIRKRRNFPRLPRAEKEAAPVNTTTTTSTTTSTTTTTVPASASN